MRDTTYKHGTLSAYVHNACRCDPCRINKNQRNNELAYLKRLRINSIAMAEGCVDCGYADHPHALDWDHVVGEKKFELGQARTRSWEIIERELNKCEPVCANCHRIRTKRRMNA